MKHFITNLALLSLFMSCSCGERWQSVHPEGMEYDTEKYIELFNGYCRSGAYDSLSMKAREVFSAREKYYDDKKLAFVAGLMATQASIFLDDYPEARRYIDTLSKMDEWEKYPNLQAMMNGVKASYDIKAGFDYPSALIHLTEALNYYRQNGDALNTCTALCNISMIYFIRRDTTGCRYAREAVEISTGNPDDPYMMCASDVVMSMMSLVKKDYAAVEKYALKAKEYADRYGYSLVYSRIYMVLSEVAMQRGDSAEAERLLDNGFKYASHSDPDFYFELALPYGRLLMDSGRYGEAEAFLTKTLGKIERNGNIRYRYQVLELLSALYDMKGDTDDSYRYYKMAVASKDSILNVNKDASFNNILDLYETASLQNVLLQRKYDMYVIAFVCILSVLAGAFFFYRYFQQNKLYKELIRHYQDYAKRTKRLKKYLNSDEDHKDDGVADEVLFSKLEKLMSEDKIYRSNEVSLDKLASMLGTNRTYISRVINRYADKSFWGYINMYRIADATSMLSDPDNDIPIKNIYEILGYNSPASFFRVFKDEVGCSPSTYREQVRRMGEHKEIL